MASKTSEQLWQPAPRISTEPKYHESDGPLSVELAAGYGLELDDWQEHCINIWLGRDSFGKWTAPNCGLSVPRQNGKTKLIEVRELYGLAVLGENILHTAHQVKTAKEAFESLSAYFDEKTGYPELIDMVVEIRKTNGQERITLNNGGVIKYVARSRSSARGFTGDLLVLDEAQELTDEQIEALLSTASAAPSMNMQVIMAGTPPGPTAPGEVFKRWRRDALNESNKKLSWHEWSVANIGDVTDTKRWYQTNPSLGIRITLTAIETELKTLTEDGFARERLGWWSSSRSFATINRVLWDRGIVGDKVSKNGELLEKFIPPTGKIAYGIKFSADGSTVSVVAAIKPDKGPVYIECKYHRSLARGTGWLVKFIVAHWKKISLISIDGRSEAEGFYDTLIQEGVRDKVLKLIKPREMCAACSILLNAVKENQLEHYNQPGLNECVYNAKKRKIGSEGGFGFGGIDDYNVAPLEAAALAHHAVLTTKRNPARKMRVG